MNKKLIILISLLLILNSFTFGTDDSPIPETKTEPLIVQPIEQKEESKPEIKPEKIKQETKPEIKKELEFTYYSQSDNKWSRMKYSWKYVKDAGCGPISLSMIVDYLNGKDKKITPINILKLSVDNKLDIYATPRTNMPKLLKLVNEKYKIKYETIKGFDNRNLSKSQLYKKIGTKQDKENTINAIKQGKIVLISVLLNKKIHYTNGVEHFLVIKDMLKNGNVIVYDPLPNHTSYKKLTPELKKKYPGYAYEVPIDILLETMTQSYSFEE